MAGSGGGTASSGPKILLAKPGLVTSGPVTGTFGRQDETTQHRSRLPAITSLNLLSDSWEFHIDRFLPFLTENTDFTVVGVIGPPGVGKSTIMNELYGFDGTSPGMLPPFTVQSEDHMSMTRHCTVGIEPRISPERLILLDTQPVFSPSALAEMMRPDGLSTISVLNGENLSAELAHEIMAIQLGVLLASICHVLLVVSDGVHDDSMWRLMLTVDLLKHGISDPSVISSSLSQSSNARNEKENGDRTYAGGEEYIATPVFVHTRVQDGYITPDNLARLKKAVAQYLSSTSFMREKCGKTEKDLCSSSVATANDLDSTPPRIFMMSSKIKDNSTTAQYESYISTLARLRDQVLSMICPSFTRTVSEREWLKNSSKIWELIKSSKIIAEYSQALQNSGAFRR